MGLVGSPVGLASEKNGFVKKAQSPKPQIYSTPNMLPRTDDVAFLNRMYGK